MLLKLITSSAELFRKRVYPLPERPSKRITGRLSSRDPNLQNIPIKTELGEEIRKCFIAPTGRVLISADYSQIQLRLLADVANVKTFRETFNSGADIHEQTARQIFGIAADAPVPRDLRRAAKTVNFSIIG